MNSKIHPVLYHFYLRLNDLLGAEIVHRRSRQSDTCIEIIFYCEDRFKPKGHINTLPEAEACGYWVICRPQTAPSRMYYKGQRVYQLYLSPVHPKKRRETARVITPLCSSRSGSTKSAAVG